MVNGTLLNFGKRYEDDLRVIFDQWQQLHLGLDALSNQKILKDIYCLAIQKQFCMSNEQEWTRLLIITCTVRTLIEFYVF